MLRVVDVDGDDVAAFCASSKEEPARLRLITEHGGAVKGDFVKHVIDIDRMHLMVLRSLIDVELRKMS